MPVKPTMTVEVGTNTTRRVTMPEAWVAGLASRGWRSR